MNLLRPTLAAVSGIILFLSASPHASAQTDSGLGSCLGFTIDPAKDFVQNFDNSCYALSLQTGSGTQESGDPNAKYDQVYYQVVPGYSLVVLGPFPNARFLTATVYDDHLAVTSRVLDNAILPLRTGMSNPFEIGAVYQPGSSYGLNVSFGGQLGTVAAGCSTSDTTIDQNFLDASQIHQGLTWTGYPNLPANFPPHETGANAAGLITIRRYIDISNAPSAVVIVRQLSNGCAITVKDAVNQNIVSVKQSPSSPWLHQTQIGAHQQFAEQIQPKYCYPTDPQNSARFFRSQDYIPIANAGANIDGNVSQSLTDLLLGKILIRARFVLPTVPNTPCTNGLCGLTGNEDMRYASLAFMGKQGKYGDVTLGAVDDNSFVIDANRNVNLIIGFGKRPPKNVTAANGYTYFDLGSLLHYNTLTRLEMRTLFPNAAFPCSAFSPAFFTMEYNPDGGSMGAYVPTVDYPRPSEIPVTPVPPVRSDTCAIPPPPPVNCNGS